MQAMYERIRNLRQDKDLKQNDLARMLNCTQACYSNYENGKRDIPTEVLITLADFYEVSIDYLVGHTNRKEPYPKR
jgi:transcriptional regulator with XRE-family HTH domain